MLMDFYFEVVHPVARILIKVIGDGSSNNHDVDGCLS
jgi:hypothetical protein